MQEISHKDLIELILNLLKEKQNNNNSKIEYLLNYRRFWLGFTCNEKYFYIKFIHLKLNVNNRYFIDNFFKDKNKLTNILNIKNNIKTEKELISFLEKSWKLYDLF